MTKKILELCEFSSGICGVWTRVKQESLELVKRGYDVYVFSSNIEKGTNKIVSSYEEVEGIKIYRFPIKFRIGENALFWDFLKKGIEISPDIIIAHVYRHPHTNQALKLAKILKKRKNCKIFLVTHAPFVSQEIRGLKLTLLTKIYDFFYSKNLNKFDRVITITKWEIPHLLKLGTKKEKIVYIPNGIPNEFFKTKPNKYKFKNIIFLGRIAPIKNLETLFKAFEIVYNKNKKIKLEIIGPIEEGYNIKDNFKSIKFLPPIYDLNQKIKKLNFSDIFVLPSIREAMPQALIEAMSLGKIVISSKTDGGKEIIEDGKNGFLFNISNEKELSEKILFCLDKKNSKIIEKIRKNARKKAYEFNLDNLINKLISLF
ncbi:MAG: glycosyltransferase family 4 protein [Candidatus Pacearchaeota archaeon]